jgi:hypothetical protein
MDGPADVRQRLLLGTSPRKGLFRPAQWSTNTKEFVEHAKRTVATCERLRAKTISLSQQGTKNEEDAHARAVRALQVRSRGARTLLRRDLGADARR